MKIVMKKRMNDMLKGLMKERINVRMNKKNKERMNYKNYMCKDDYLCV